MANKLKLNGEYDGLGLWKKDFEKDGKAMTSIGGTIIVDGNIPNGEYYVNIYKNTEKKSETSPDYTMYFAEKDAKPIQQSTSDDDF